MNRVPRWCGPPFDDPVHATLLAYQESLSVGLIATNRSDFETCRIDEPLAEVVARNLQQGFDFLPVIGDRPSDDESIVGVLSIAALPEDRDHAGTVREHLEPLFEGHLIGADASLLSFVRDADSSPFRLIISGRQIRGLVSISDLQRLPVRAALFAMVTQLEMSMADTIRFRCPKPQMWMNLLPPGRIEKIREQMKQAREADTLVDPVLYTQFADKVTIVRRLFGPSETETWEPDRFRDDLKAIQNLRDQLAHANNYAATRNTARRLCEHVRAIEGWIQFFAERALGGTRSISQTD